MKKIILASQFLLFTLFLTSCSQPLNNTTTGAIGGTALGAGLGAIIGSATGNAGAGIAIGSAAGAVGGALVGSGMDDQDRKTQAVQSQLSRDREALEENRRILEELRNRGADARITNRGVSVNLPDVLFEFGKSNLTYEAEQTARQIAEAAGSVKGRMITVEGHTDSIGSDQANQKLSEDRADRVARTIISDGVSREKVRSRGLGKTKPIASNESSEGRARNRRVEVIIENQ
jgi:outer membrane protein OmpA-like peptidoglycan-associated protein